MDTDGKATDRTKEEDLKRKLDFSKLGFGTGMIHAGQEPDPSYGALATPIYQTSTFCFDTAEEGGEIFSGERAGYAYTRGGNPTTTALEQKLSILEGGEAAIATASGMGAVGGALLAYAKAGDHILRGRCIYSCTEHVFRENLSKFNIEVTSADFSDLEAVAGGIKENTKLIYFESMSNPMMELSDIQEISRIAHDRGIKVVVDNTFTPPPEIRPLSLGADLVVHSTTKYINGHGDAIGGAIIGAKEELDPIRSGITTKLLGTTPSPFNSYLVLRGMQTMELRMQRHCENGFAIASFLEGNPHVKRVYYPGLSSSPQHALAEKMMKGNYGGILAFELKDGIRGMKAFDACKKLLNSFTIPSIAVSLGDPGTLVEHAASMTHGAVPAEEREKEGITDALIRVSAGLEDKEDLLADFRAAFSVLD